MTERASAQALVLFLKEKPMQKKLTAFCAAFLLIMLLTVSASATAPRFEGVSANTPFVDSIIYDELMNLQWNGPPFVFI